MMIYTTTIVWEHSETVWTSSFDSEDKREEFKKKFIEEAEKYNLHVNWTFWFVDDRSELNSMEYIDYLREEYAEDEDEEEVDYERKAVQIKWDTGGVSVDDLPETEVIPPDVADENIADYLTDVYGWRVESFSVKSEI